MAERMLVIGESSSGKALKDTELVLTENDWVEIGKIKVGDIVFDEVGKPTRVLKVHKYVANIYRIYFEDGTNIDCCKEHLWKIYDSKNINTPYVIDTLGLMVKIKNNEDNIAYYVPILLYKDTKLAIKDIVNLDITTNVTCLEVDSPYHTFLTKNHIVTHNSSSLRNMKGTDTVIIKCFNKRLPFKNGDGKFKVYTPNNYEELIACIVDIIDKDKNKKVKNIVIDDIIYFMSDEFMKTINVKGFEKFSNMASGLYGAFKDIPDLLLKERPDILVTFMTHATINELGNISIRTIGKLIDEKVKLEGMFEMVLLAKMNEDGQYVFQVHNMNNSKSVVKTPMGMFETDEIDNDLAYVIKLRNEYYGIETPQEEKAK